MRPSEHIQQLRDACKGLDEHAESNGAAWTAINDLQLDIHELDKAWEDEKMMGNRVDRTG